MSIHQQNKFKNVKKMIKKHLNEKLHLVLSQKDMAFILTTVIRTTLRKLIQIVNKNLGQDIQPFDVNDERYLRSPLVNCRKWLNIEEQTTLFKIVNIVYQLKIQPVYEDEVVNLYGKILRQLEKRTKQKSNNIDKRGADSENRKLPLKNVNPSPQLIQKPIELTNPTNRNLPQKIKKKALNNEGIDKNISPAIQKELAQLYVKFKNLALVTEILKKKYSDLDLSIDLVATIVQKLVKVSLNKVKKLRQQLIQRVGKAPPLTLNAQKIQKICKSNQTINIRVLVIQFLLAQ